MEYLKKSSECGVCLMPIAFRITSRFSLVRHSHAKRTSANDELENNLVTKGTNFHPSEISSLSNKLLWRVDKN